MQETKSRSKYWAYLAMWFGILLLFIIFYPQLFWMALPGIVTNFSLALGIM